jgi:tagatose 1,6-diphosphate aldolase
LTELEQEVKQILSPGRWRGLRASSTPDNIFTILAFDQRGSYRKMLPEGASYETAVQIKQEIAVNLSDYVSAVLLDVEYGLGPALNMAGHTGLLMSLEKSGYSGDSTYRRVAFVEGWTVSKIKQINASAVKLMVYYHPGSGALAEEIEAVIKQVTDECHRHDIPLFVEPMSYSLKAGIAKESAEFAKTRPGVVIETAKRLSKLNPDVLKMEFPVDAAFDADHRSWQSACESLGAACTVPWVLLSAGVDFDIFVEQARVACQAGASGYLAGRAIWKEAVAMDDEHRRRFLNEVAVDRLNRLNDITHREARPWTDFYEPIPITSDWWVGV